MDFNRYSGFAKRFLALWANGYHGRALPTELSRLVYFARCLVTTLHYLTIITTPTTTSAALLFYLVLAFLQF
jgi:hypothetical protein